MPPRAGSPKVADERTGVSGESGQIGVLDQGRGAAAGELSEAEKWALVERVAASPQFRRSARLRDFLTYICDRTLKNELGDLREHQIGCSVFQRPAGYNPSEDNIVRVEARQLRRRLAEYFAAEGKEEPVVIVMPKGSYLPMFERRELVAGELAEPLDAATAVLPAPGVAPAGPRSSRAAMLASAAATAAMCLLAWWLVQGRGGQPVALRDQPPALAFPWSVLFEGSQPAHVVLADSCLALLQDLTRQRVTLADYMNRTYLAKLQASERDPAIRATLELIAARQYTSLADVSLVRKLAQLAPGPRNRLLVSYARNVNIRDFKTNNMILVGSAHSNPWVELFDAKMNFQLDVDPATGKIVVRNKAPLEGEQKTYIPGGRNGTPGEAYAVIALLPNLDRTGNVLLIEGTTMEGTEAGGDFLNNPARLTQVLARLGLPDNGSARYFEVLLKSGTVGGTSKDTEPIAYRRID